MKKLLFTLLFSVLSVFGVSHAENGLSFEPQLPDNQIDKNLSYFNVKITTPYKDTYYLKIRNDAAIDKHIKIVPANALSNSNGGVDYHDKEKRETSTLTNKLYFGSKYLKIDQSEWTVKGKSTVSVPIQINIDKSLPKGELLAGVKIFDLDTVNQQNSKGLQIINESAYAIGMVFVIDEALTTSDYEVKEAWFSNRFDQPFLYSNIVNKLAKVEKNAKIEAIIKHKGTVIDQFILKLGSLSPYSSFVNTQNLNGTYKEGEVYEVTFNFFDKDGKIFKTDKKKIEFKNESLTIVVDDKGAPVKHIGQIETKEKNSHFLWIMIGQGVLIVLFIFLIFYFRKKKNSKQD